MHVRRLTAGLAAALLLPLGACTDGDSKADPPEPTASGSPTPSETASAGPTLPAAAQGDDEAAAKAFVKFYFELISDAMVTGETGPLRTFSTKRCGSCSNLAQKIDSLHASEATLKTKGWQPDKYRHQKLTPTSHAFYLRVRTHAQSLYEGDTLIDRDPANLVPMRVVVVYRNDEWRLDWMENLQ